MQDFGVNHHETILLVVLSKSSLHQNRQELHSLINMWLKFVNMITNLYFQCIDENTSFIFIKRQAGHFYVVS